MLSAEMARYRIDDRVREAQADHRVRSTRRGREDAARTFARRIGTAVSTVALWPFKH